MEWAGMGEAEFQDRCLKPLGHPSSLARSTTDALALADKSRHCRRIAVATDSRYFGPDLPQTNGGHHGESGGDQERIA
jgi:hypothetical protein